ncbi:uncharacterized protein BJ212DRAFT_1302868 [Suillus subaureus]|uniref:ATP-citrate synthase citrate-binding domain-containing protein n=1 Tax=Suillus subaureus TaxID=48587 RepID=A0A9P7E260_9AGAM|nr:uncharacterized protein BJ212DRAFT_1302868 [Suillus subaureus]KAG1808983.1 hypothetical protein BJ212DRAFT_1302868 [Suillus subaureus]
MKMVAVDTSPVNCKMTDCISNYINTNLQTILLREVPAHRKGVLTDFIVGLDLHFAYPEINSLVVLDASSIHYLDMAAKLNQIPESICCPKWAVARDSTVYEATPAASTTGSKANADHSPPMAWPASFGRDLTQEEAYIQTLHASTGASLKLTVLDPTSCVWTIVAGGGASVVYSDAIAAAGFAHELTNYGEHSDASNEGQTFEYAKVISICDFQANKLISGIGHKIKSVNNPDLRVELVKEYVGKNFLSHSLLDYVLAVEKVTTSKKDTLILNVDGCIGVVSLTSCTTAAPSLPKKATNTSRSMVSPSWVAASVSSGNQKRLRALLYRHPC